jgi:hypothetical protein
MARHRSIVVRVDLAAAMLVAFVAPRIAFSVICCALIPHLRAGAAPGKWL